MTYKDIFNNLKLDCGLKQYLDTRPLEVMRDSYDYENLERIKKDTINNMPVIFIGDLDLPYLLPPARDEHSRENESSSSNPEDYSEKAKKYWRQITGPHSKAQSVIDSIFYCLRTKWDWNFIDEVKITHGLKKKQSILDLTPLPLEFDFEL